MDSFIALPSKERTLLLNEAAKRHRRMSAKIVEKDLWVCWTLKRLFEIPEIAPHLIFKGGTSLSKAYKLIDRFSEDIDLTINKEYLSLGIEDSLQNVSTRKKRQEFRKILDKASIKIVFEKLLPLLEKHFSSLLNSRDWKLNICESDPLTILFQYPRTVEYGMSYMQSNSGKSDSLEENFGYIKPIIRLEFGARGDSFPVTKSNFIPYVAEILPEIFDNADGINVTVSTLEAERTFWEKITILHDLYHKERDKPLKKTIARHYYDVVLLTKKGVAAKALKRRDLLEAVVKNSRLNCTNSNDSPTYKAYDDLLQYKIKLAPQMDKIAHLKQDYVAMQDNGMFFGDFPSFAEIIKQLTELENILNTDKSGS
jgi:predicted nucleotidyltransferase component of viral defense system